jgi:choline dehydrogenase-like flavoprotein
MANLNLNSVRQNTYDAIVIGSGISGGWAAKELTEKGLKTLVLERGKDVKHIVDYPTANLFPYELEHRGTSADRQRGESDCDEMQCIFGGYPAFFREGR